MTIRLFGRAVPCCFASASSRPEGWNSGEAISVCYCPLCSSYTRRPAAIFVSKHTVRKTQRARSLVATYFATGASTQVVLVETRGVFAHPFSPASSHPQVYFCVSTKRVPIVSEEVLEFQCHETQNDRRWGWWSGNNCVQSGFRHAKHVEPSVRTTRLVEGKGLR